MVPGTNVPESTVPEERVVLRGRTCNDGVQDTPVLGRFVVRDEIGAALVLSNTPPDEDEVTRQRRVGKPTDPVARTVCGMETRGSWPWSTPAVLETFLTDGINISCPEGALLKTRLPGTAALRDALFLTEMPDESVSWPADELLVMFLPGGATLSCAGDVFFTASLSESRIMS
jgi:hypothetical protein